MIKETPPVTLNFNQTVKNMQDFERKILGLQQGNVSLLQPLQDDTLKTENSLKTLTSHPDPIVSKALVTVAQVYPMSMASEIRSVVSGTISSKPAWNVYRGVVDMVDHIQIKSLDLTLGKSLIVLPNLSENQSKLKDAPPKLLGLTPAWTNLSGDLFKSIGSIPSPNVSFVPIAQSQSTPTIDQTSYGSFNQLLYSTILFLDHLSKTL